MSADGMTNEDVGGFLLFVYRQREHVDAWFSDLCTYTFEGVFAAETADMFKKLPDSKQFMAFDLQSEDYRKQINLMARGVAKDSMEAADAGRVSK